MIGRGGGGEVWSVRDRVTGRDLAFKVLADDAGEAEVMALVREAVTLSGLEGLGVPPEVVLEPQRDEVVLSIADVTQARRNAAALERRVAERTAAMLTAKTAAEQANLSKTRFLAAASHDLLQPLNAARLFVSALNERKVDRGTRGLIDQTESALNSVEDLLEALLEISKLDAGAIKPELSDVSLADLFGALRAEFSAVAASGGIGLEVETTDLFVRSDARLIRRVIQNLLSNALRYTDVGKVRLSVDRAGKSAVISVTDTGCGIAEEHHQAIFEEFRRFDGGRSRGMGLGLAIVQRAIKMLDHPIRIESEPGKGSRFSVTIPIAKSRHVPEPAGPLTARRVSLARKVLVIDNDSSILAGMSALLTGWGCDVATASGEAGALTHLARTTEKPDLIIADYHLDDGQLGDAVIRTLRKTAGVDLPAMIVTADRTPELRDRLLKEGLRVLQKPVKPAQLRALLTSLAT